jgi:hypothetical protein
MTINSEDLANDRNNSVSKNYKTKSLSFDESEHKKSMVLMKPELPLNIDNDSDIQPSN